MSQPREYYYTAIKKWIMMSDKLPSDRLQMQTFQRALHDAIDETSKMSNGELRMIAIDEILFAKTKTYEGVAQELHYDWRTIQNWITAFINLVGQKAGF